MYAGPWSHCLVLQALGELRWSLHLVLQRLGDIFCLWAQQWAWDKGRSRRWGGGWYHRTAILYSWAIHSSRKVCVPVCVLPSLGIWADAVLSPLLSRVILFRANKALPAFCLKTIAATTKKTLIRKKQYSKPKGKVFRSITFHFCLARNFFIFSLDRFLVSSSPESNAAIQGWASASSQDIRRLGKHTGDCYIGG